MNSLYFQALNLADGDWEKMTVVPCYVFHGQMLPKVEQYYNDLD